MVEGPPWLDLIKNIGSYGTPATLVIIGLLAWWQVLPKLIDAISNRQSKIEERMALLLDSATERFEKQLKEADERHDDCMAGQRVLIQRIDEQDEKLSVQSRLIDAQQDMITGLKAQLRQLQVSSVRVEGSPISGLARGVVEALDHIDDITTPGRSTKEASA